MYKLNSTRRTDLAALITAADKAAVALEDHLRPLYDKAAKLTEAGHSATAERMKEPFKKLFYEWAIYRQKNLFDLELLGRSALIQHEKHVKGLIATLESLSMDSGDLSDSEVGEEIAFRRNIGELYSETLCERNELAKLLQLAIPVIDRKDPGILADASQAFEAFNMIEHYGRVHSFSQLEKLSMRLREAKHLICKCNHRVRNYIPTLPE